MKEEELIPQHVAIIMDGNGRWAKKRLLPRSLGHRAGMNRMVPLVEHIFDCGVEFVTLYALSTENLNRDKEEVDSLFSLFREYFKKNVEKLKEGSIRLRVIGDMSLLPPDIVEMVANGERETAAGKRGTLALAVAYGARNEILRAVQSAKGETVTEEQFSSLLTTAGMPDPDFLIRTGNEMRLSNFLLWQAAYAELYFSPKMFPDFSDGEFDKALKEYQKRDRRFGKVRNR